jgi:hypothetical protein
LGEEMPKMQLYSEVMPGPVSLLDAQLPPEPIWKVNTIVECHSRNT